MAISKEKLKELERLEKLETKNTKYCAKCKKVKPLYEFSVKPNSRKLAPLYCIECSKEKANEREILRNYDITLKEYDRLLKKQNGKCKICATKTPGRKGRFHIDHDHATNKIRGLLCINCNIFLGHAKDDIKILAKAITYLTKSRK